MARPAEKKTNGQNGKANGQNGKAKRITRYTFEDVKEPRPPETGHTALMPAEEQVVFVDTNNGWPKTLQISKLPETDKPVVVDMEPIADPVLFWSGKRSRHRIPLLPLQRNEIVSESRIARIVGEATKSAQEASNQLRMESIFGDLEKSRRELEKAERISFYTHDEEWKNKLICGDSAQVMESLLQYESLRGSVQVIYVDPPYGIKYQSNFQQRVDTRDMDMKDTADDVLTIKAFRDTWQLGIHSYLSYLHERLYIARDLLHESGSIFLQIGNVNQHLARQVLDEVFGALNFCSLITFVKTTGAGSPSGGTTLLPQTTDFLLWYAKDKSRVKYHQLYTDKVLGEPGTTQYTWIDIEGKRRPATEEELADAPKKARFFAHGDLTSQTGGPTTTFEVKFEGKTFRPPKGGWKTNEEGMKRLIDGNRLMIVGNSLRYIRYLDDFPAIAINDVWLDTIISGFGDPKVYVVQTVSRVVERCICMTSDPGDIVLDITCGSGTSATAAEKMGRRWITCDTSRVAVNVARQRLLSTVFPNWALLGKRVSDGFVLRKLRRVTLASIARGQEPETVELFDQPELDRSGVRVCGPFEVMSLGRYSVEDWKGYVVGKDSAGHDQITLQNYISVIARLYRKDAAIESASGFVHAINESDGQRIAISVGPISGRVTARQVNDAVQDALSLGLLEIHILGWAFEANVGEVKATLERRGRIKVQLMVIRPDVLAEGLKPIPATQLFSPLALPDVSYRGEHEGWGKTCDGSAEWGCRIRPGSQKY